MRVGIDLDGVCYDFGNAYRTWIKTKVNCRLECPPETQWEFYKQPGWDQTTPEFLQHFADGVNAGVIFTWGKPYLGVQDAFRAIKAAGHTIHIITDRSIGRPGVAVAATSQWLHQHGLPFDSLTFSADKTVVAVDCHIDDKAENYLAMKAAGVDSYLLTRAWNKHVPNAQRVLDLLHYAEVISK